MPATATVPLTKRQTYDGILAQLKQEFQSWRAPLQDIGDYIAPYLHEFQTEANTNNGDRRDGLIINETPCRALDIAAAGLFNGLCDPTEEWMGLETDDPELNKLQSVRAWCEEASKRHLGEVAKSNFYTVAPEDFKSILAFGTCASITLEAFDDSCLWYGAFPIGTYYIGNSARRHINIVARELRMNVRQMAEEFGRENMSEAAQIALDSNRGEQWFSVVHIVRPNPTWKRTASFQSKDKRFLSCYYELGQKQYEDKVLAEAGYDMFPIQACRWATRGNASWGFGLGHGVLSSSRALQAYEIDLALAREKQINPPLVVPSGVNLAGLSLLPGALNQASDPAGSQGLRPLHEVRFDLAAGQQGVAELENRIQEGLWNNFFLMISSGENGKRTAREVMELASEKRLVLTPILRLTHEYLTPRIACDLDIMGKRGKLPPFPPEMAGSTLRIVYKSVLAKAAELQRGMATKDHLLNFALPMASVDPTFLDNYDMDEAARETSANDGLPARIMRDPADVDKMRQARQQLAAAQQQKEDQAHAAETAQTLSKTDTSSKSALTDVLSAAEEQGE